MNNKEIKIGVLGGSFDPAHKGHLVISKEAKKIFKLKYVVWAITRQNPFKKNNPQNLKERLKDCKKIIGLNKFIKVKFYEDVIKSNRTIDLINHFKKNKKNEIYFLMGLWVWDDSAVKRRCLELLGDPPEEYLHQTN